MELLVMLWASLLGLSGVGAQFNQECYFAKGQRAGSAIIPCLESAKGVSPCCQNGDICLSDSACWSPKTGVTYQYGCTDSSFEDDRCPKKCGLDASKSNWIGLVYCNDTTNMWACNHPDTCGNCPNSSVWDPAIQVIPDNPRHCQDLKTVKAAFAGPVSLMPSLSLPHDVGGSTLYFSPSGSTFIPVTGYMPAWARDKTSSTAGGGGLSGGAKIGVGVAIAVGAILLIVLAVVFLLRRRYKKRRRRSAEDAAPALYGGDAKSELPADNEVKSPAHEMESPQSVSSAFSPYYRTTEPGTPRELGDAQIFEMVAARESRDGEEMRYELDGRESRYELPATRDSKE